LLVTPHSLQLLLRSVVCYASERPSSHYSHSAVGLCQFPHLRLLCGRLETFILFRHFSYPHHHFIRVHRQRADVDRAL